MRSINGSEDRRSLVSATSSGGSTLVAESIASSKTTSLRKFTAGVGKVGHARETREAVRNVITTQNPSRRPPLSSPINYEQFIDDKRVMIENDPQRDLLVFPRDDFQESFVATELRTSEQPFTEEEVREAKWLLAHESLLHFANKRSTIAFNYANFGGDYNSVESTSETNFSPDSGYGDYTFESDLIAEEERDGIDAVMSNTVVVEGFVTVGREDNSLLDNFKSASKKKYCIVRRQDAIVIEFRKLPHEAPKREAVQISAVQMKSSKKGRPVLEIVRSVEASDTRELFLSHDDPAVTKQWCDAIQEALESQNRDDLSLCGDLPDRSNKSSVPAPDSDNSSIGSEDSAATARDVTSWRGRNSAARALQPPIVERKNLFSLYYNMSPLTNKQGRSSPFDFGQKSENEKRPRAAETISFTVAVDDLHLKLVAGNNETLQVEPFFARLFLFDSSTGARVTEEFHYDFPGGAKAAADRALISFACDGKDTDESSTSKRLQNLWIFISIERILSSDTNGDIYMKSSDAKATAKLQKAINTASARLRGYRQKFAWAARQLFPEVKQGTLKDNQRYSQWQFSGPLQLYRCEANRICDADVQKIVTDFAKLEKTGKNVINNGTVNVSIRFDKNYNDGLKCFTPSLMPTRVPRVTRDESVYELQSFERVCEPAAEFINLLYVYPVALKYDSQKVFSKARNICCSVKLIRDGSTAARTIINRLAPQGPLITEAHCAVQHHQQTPNFGDEIKMRLPVSLSPSDHLLFTFSHISVNNNSSAKSPDSVEHPVGYAWLPLVWKKDQLTLESDEQEFALPVAAEIPNGYFRNKPFGMGKGDEGVTIKWVEQKPLFRVRLRVVSSVFTTEPRLQSFFQAYQRLEAKHVVGDATELLSQSREASPASTSTSATTTNNNADTSSQLTTSQIRSCSPLASSSVSHHDLTREGQDLVIHTEALSVIGIDKIVPFLPVVLSRLFALIPRAPTQMLSLATLRSLISICDRCSLRGKTHLLNDFVRYDFSVAGDNADEFARSLCKSLALLLPTLQSSEVDLSALYRQLNFLFDVIIKSLAQSIVRKQLHKVDRRNRFCTELNESISSLVHELVPQMMTKQRDVAECSEANMALARFLTRCLSVLDRGSVFRWMHFVVQHLDENDAKVFREWKMDFLRTVSQHEHFVPLALPLLIDDREQIQRLPLTDSNPPPNNTSNASGLLTRFFNLIFQPTTSMDVGDVDRYTVCINELCLCPSFVSHHFLVGLLFQELLACLREHRDHRRKTIQLVRNMLAKHSYDSRYGELQTQRRIAVMYAPFVRISIELLNEIEQSVSESYTPNDGIGQSTAPEKNGESKIAVPLPEKLDLEEVQDLTLSLLFVLQRLPKRITATLWNESNGANAKDLLRLLRVALCVFRYRGQQHAEASTAKKLRCKNYSLTLLPPSSSRNSSVDYSSSFRSENGSCGPSFGAMQVLSLSQEVALVVLECLQTYSQHMGRARAPGMDDKEIFCLLLQLHLSLLDPCWSECVRLHALAGLAVFVNVFRSRLFEGASLDSLESLIKYILLQMSSRMPNVQNSAAALLQIILRNGYELAQGHLAERAMRYSMTKASAPKRSEDQQIIERLGRPGSQTGVALAHLIGTKESGFSTMRFERGLGHLQTLLHSHGQKSTAFERATNDLVKQIRGVMRASAALSASENDTFRFVELRLELASSYRGSASLRSGFLESTSETHEKEQKYTESAVCLGHCVAIMARELAEAGILELDWKLFDWISKSIVEQERTSHATSVQAAGFSTEALITKIEKTARMLTLAERYEAIGPLYRIIIPVLESKSDFTALLGVYAELQQVNSRAAEVKMSNKRHLGEYFRVLLWGDDFGDDHNSEWIIREQGLASLAETSLRLKDMYSNVFGHERVFVHSHSQDEMPDKTTGAYIYLTHVEPVLSESRDKYHFWSHTNISKFFYDSGVMEADEEETTSREAPLHRHALKRTFLTVDGSFPCSQRRLRVCDKRTQQFNPLECACQKLLVKASQIQAVVDASASGRKLDIKGLHLLLQGSVLPTVNAGPLAYAEAFNQPEQKKRYGEEGIAKLREAFRELMRVCEIALSINEVSVGADQRTYHQVLQSSFEAMHERLESFFGVSLREAAKEVAKPPTAIHVLDSIGGVNA